MLGAFYHSSTLSPHTIGQSKLDPLDNIWSTAEGLFRSCQWVDADGVSLLALCRSLTSKVPARRLSRQEMLGQLCLQHACSQLTFQLQPKEVTSKAMHHCRRLSASLLAIFIACFQTYFRCSLFRLPGAVNTSSAFISWWKNLPITSEMLGTQSFPPTFPNARLANRRSL